MVPALAISLCLGVVAYQHNASTSELCQASVQADPAKALAMTSLCQPSQQSWFSWLQGNSRSTQFHFVDLLELLNRFNHRG
ncbi:MAG: hypothetical protein KJ556_19160 [Gammaproteobacteria bacterium]|nr:hypothetical protein [Gammaproteobacteria bacterium]MBU2056325.1 hypothetical protein [Gammaproteobacteria bacterium]MBU2177218.1 hypothetical protein [Gammaproteobacteria bacterium]MBU2246120.1 hypothetical protein [Gammaproteobacteria bacterium]MBU2344744.1 hypothetical protein [Gammaproteobacteria bacterium]